MAKITILTSIFNSVFTLLILKFFHSFHLIKWHPTSFMDSIYFVRLFGAPEKWFTLGVLIAIVSAVVFLITTFLTFLPNLFTALLYSAFFVFIIYSFIYDFQYDLKTWKSISVPFIALILISARFIVETSTFYTKEKLFSHTK